MDNRKYCKWISFMIDQLVRSYIVIGWICEKNVIHQATYRKYIRSYIGCICKKNVFASPQVFHKSAFVVAMIAFVKNLPTPNVCGPQLVRRIGLDSSIWWYVLICWAQNS